MINELIVQKANYLFEQYGLRSVTIDDVCKELRISKKTFYNHFTQKEELVDAVITFQKKQQIEKYEKLLKNKNAIESLIIIINEIRKSMENESQFICHDLEKYYPKIFKKHEDINRENTRIGFELNLKQGIDEGFYRQDIDVELLSHFHSIQIKNTFEQLKETTNKYTKKRLLEFFIDLIVHFIANEKGLQYMNDHKMAK